MAVGNDDLLFAMEHWPPSSTFQIYQIAKPLQSEQRNYTFF